MVVIEFKRKMTDRLAVAQILDYGSALIALDPKALRDLILNHGAQDVGELADLKTSRLLLILVAAEADSSAKRIVSFLASSTAFEIEIVTFTFARLPDGREIVARSVVVAETTPASLEPIRTSESDIIELARTRGVKTYLDILNQVSSRNWKTYEVVSAYGGSVRYWVALPDTNGKVIFVANVGGKLFNSPIGALDLWVWTEVAARYGQTTSEAVIKGLEAFQCLKQTPNRFFLRIASDAMAQKFFSLLLRWDLLSEETRLKQEADSTSSELDDG